MKNVDSLSRTFTSDALSTNPDTRSIASAWAMVEASPDGMLLVDSDGTVVIANSQAQELFRADGDELNGAMIEEFVPKRLRDLHQDFRAGYQAEPKSRAMGGQLVLWARRRDDTEFPAEIALSPVSIDGQPMVVTTVRDVTERWAAEAHGHAVLHSIDRAHDGLFMFSPETLKFMYVNQGGSAQLGYTHDELLAMTPVDVIPELSLEKFTEMLAPIVSGDVESQVFTMTYQSRSGVDLPVEIVVDCPPAPPGPTASRMFVAQVRDISDRLAADRNQERQRRWLMGLSDVRSHLLADGSLDEALQIICHHVGEMADADGVVVEIAGKAEDQRPNSVVVGVGSLDANTTILIWRDAGRDEFSTQEVELVESFVQQSGVAVELVRSRGDKQRLELLEDRERIARDLHDLAIQRLFAAGMGLQSVLGMGIPAAAAARIDATVGELDETIRELRSTIFHLNRDHAPRSVSSQIREIVDDHHEQLGFSPSVSLAVGIDSIRAACVEELLPTINELLSNVARHARADEANVVVTIDGTLLTLTLDDNGVGIGVDSSRGGGIDNLETRAERCGGGFEVVSKPATKVGQSDGADAVVDGAIATWTARL